MQNKKSQVEDLLQFMFVVIVLVFIVLIFSFKDLSKKKLTNEEIDIETIAQDSSGLLVNYLRIPFVLDNTNNPNIGDTINMYFINNQEDILNQIKTITNEFFSQSFLESDISSWSLEIKYPDKKLLIIQSTKSISEYPIRIEISKIAIPTYHNQIIEIRLFQTRKDERTSGLL